MSTTHRYGAPAIALHWAVALLIFAGWGLGYYMVDLKLSPQKLQYFSYHKWIGVTVFLLACLRAAWRITHAPPPVNLAHPPWQRQAAALVHRLLYALMFVIPLSGWLYSSASGYPVKYFGVIPLPDLVGKDKALADAFKQVHVLLAWLLAAIVAGHAGAALQHHLFHRDDTLARMLPFVRSRKAST